MKIDHHIHTSRHSPDSSIDPVKLVERACEIGLDAVVITEHDYQWQPDELAELAARAPTLACLLRGRDLGARGALPGLRPAFARGDATGHSRARPDRGRAAPPGRDRGRPSVSVGPAVRPDRRRARPGVRRARAGEQQHLPGDASQNPGAPESSIRWERPARATLTRSTSWAATSASFPARIETISDFVAALRNRQGRPGNRNGVYLSSGPAD